MALDAKITHALVKQHYPAGIFDYTSKFRHRKSVKKVYNISTSSRRRKLIFLCFSTLFQRRNFAAISMSNRKCSLDNVSTSTLSCGKLAYRVLLPSISISLGNPHNSYLFEVRVLVATDCNVFEFPFYTQHCNGRNLFHKSNMEILLLKN